MGTVDFVKECRLNSITPVAGIEFRDENNTLLYTGIAINNKGFRELNEFLSWHNLNDSPLPPAPPVFNHVYVIYPFLSNLPRRLKEHEFIGIQPANINKLVTSRFRYDQSKLIAVPAVTFAEDTDYLLHQHLRAIDNNTLLSKLTPDQLAATNDKMLPWDLISIAYEDYTDILRNTERMVEDCSIDFDFTTVKNKRTKRKKPTLTFMSSSIS